MFVVPPIFYISNITNKCEDVPFGTLHSFYRTALDDLFEILKNTQHTKR